MASTFTTNIGIEKPATGDKAGTWGTMSNTNMDLIDEATNGVVEITLAATGSSGSPNDLPITNGTSSNGRNKYIEFKDGGDLGGTVFVQLTPNDSEKVVFVRNSLSGSRSILIFQGTYDASRDVELLAGKDYILKFPGSGSSSTVINILENIAIANDLSLVSDSAKINFGADADVTLTHVADTGVTLASGTNATTLQVDSNLADANAGPKLILNRTSASPADNDVGGQIDFKMENDNDEQFSAAKISATALDVSDGTEDSSLTIETIVGGSATAGLIIKGATIAGSNDTDTSIDFEGSDIITFNAGGSEDMRISPDRILFGTTVFSTSTGLSLVPSTGFLAHTTPSGAAKSMVGYYNGGSNVGEIRTSTTATQYLTSSDYRLKENVSGMTDGIARVKQLKPSRFNFIADKDTTLDGFLAHEVSSIVPEAVSGTKDEMQDDGKTIKGQGIDQAKLVPLLTAALQEAIAKIEVLETKVAALEAK
tara:strand:+ start:2323 stop:3768 length:1446 start_codon:yes stop_codon:yes gene_type:complete